MPNPILIANTLVIALGSTVDVPKRSDTLWLSKAGVVTATVDGSRARLSGTRPGLVFASGLGVGGDAETTRLLVTTDANRKALSLCRADVTKFFPVTLLEIEPREGHDAAAILRATTACGFDDLRLGSTAQVALEPAFVALESRLRKSGELAPELIEWKEGKRRVRARRASLALRLGSLAPFYEIAAALPPTAPRPGRTLVFDVSLFELSRTRAEALGLRLPQNLDLELRTRDAALGAARAFLDVGFEFGENLGIGKILARPRLRAQPGQRALFHSGGEIPIRNASLTTSQTTWKSYGLALELTPAEGMQAGDREVAVEFKLELSEPDPSTSVDGVPGLIVRKLASRFDLRTDENTLLSTMVQSRSGVSRAHPKGLGELPGVGRLFANRREYEQSNELWISVRPSWHELSGAPPAPTPENSL